MNPLPAWHRGPFEVLANAEFHYRQGTDRDRRAALIGFDQSIETSISAYIRLNPNLRNGRAIAKEYYAAHKLHYDEKLKCLFEEAEFLKVNLRMSTKELIHCHELRNDLYHSGTPHIPPEEDLFLIRNMALDVFALLFGHDDVAERLGTDYESRIEGLSGGVQRLPLLDALLEEQNEYIDLGFGSYSVPEVMRVVEPEAYLNEASLIQESPDLLKDLKKTYPEMIDPAIGSARVVRHSGRTYLVLERSGTLRLADLATLKDGLLADEEATPGVLFVVHSLLKECTKFELNRLCSIFSDSVEFQLFEEEASTAVSQPAFAT